MHIITLVVRDDRDATALMELASSLGIDHMNLSMNNKELPKSISERFREIRQEKAEKKRAPASESKLGKALLEFFRGRPNGEFAYNHPALGELAVAEGYKPTTVGPYLSSLMAEGLLTRNGIRGKYRLVTNGDME